MCVCVYIYIQTHVSLLINGGGSRNKGHKVGRSFEFPFLSLRVMTRKCVWDFPVKRALNSHLSNQLKDTLFLSFSYSQKNIRAQQLAYSISNKESMKIENIFALRKWYPFPNLQTNLSPLFLFHWDQTNLTVRFPCMYL